MRNVQVQVLSGDSTRKTVERFESLTSESLQFVEQVLVCQSYTGLFLRLGPDRLRFKAGERCKDDVSGLRNSKVRDILTNGKKREKKKQWW